MVGVVTDVTERISKTGKKFALVCLSDPSGDYEVMIFSDLLIASRPFLEKGSEWALKVTARFSGEGVRLQAQEVHLLEDYFAGHTLSLLIGAEDIPFLKRVLNAAEEGATKFSVSIRLEDPKVDVILNKAKGVRLTPHVRSDLMTLRSQCDPEVQKDAVVG